MSTNAAFYLDQRVGFGANVVGAAFYLDSNVNANTPTPHIWDIISLKAQPGSPFTIYAFGIGSASTTYAASVFATVSGVKTLLTPTSWTHKTASSAADLSKRTIDPVHGVVDPEHIEIMCSIIAGMEPPGVPAWIETDGP